MAQMVQPSSNTTNGRLNNPRTLTLNGDEVVDLEAENGGEDNNNAAAENDEGGDDESVSSTKTEYKEYCDKITLKLEKRNADVKRLKEALQASKAKAQASRAEAQASKDEVNELKNELERLRLSGARSITE